MPPEDDIEWVPAWLGLPGILPLDPERMFCAIHGASLTELWASGRLVRSWVHPMEQNG